MGRELVGGWRGATRRLGGVDGLVSMERSFRWIAAVRLYGAMAAKGMISSSSIAV